MLSQSREMTAGIVAVVVAAGCALSEGAVQPEDEGVRIINVEAAPATLSDFVDYIRITGEVEAMSDVTLSAAESGSIERFWVEKGARVKKRDVIASIDAAVLRAQAEEARAAASLAREQYERQRILWEEEEIGSEIRFLEAKAQAEAAAARLGTLEARLERTAIRSPVTGVFDEKFLEAGEMAVPGTPVARVVDVRRVKVVGGVPERFALSVRQGSRANVTFDIIAGRQFEGRIGFVGTSVDAINRTIRIEVVLDNPKQVVKPQMIANVQIVRERLDDVIVAPQQVVERTENGYQVFVVVERDGHAVAEAREVRLGAAYANRVVIEQGLSPGDRLVTVGNRLVDDGSRVRVVEANDDAPDARGDRD